MWNTDRINATSDILRAVTKIQLLVFFGTRYINIKNGIKIYNSISTSSDQNGGLKGDGESKIIPFKYKEDINILPNTLLICLNRSAAQQITVMR